MACPVSVLGCWFEPTWGGGGGVIQLVSPAIASQISLNNVHKGGLRQRNFQCPHQLGQFGLPCFPEIHNHELFMSKP